MIVIDASAVVEALLATRAGKAVVARMSRAGDLHAPCLVDIEVAQALRRIARRQDIDPRDFERAIKDLADLPVTRWSHQPLMTRVWALRGTISAYDAAYVALAETLEAPLITLDGRLAASVGHLARIECPAP